MGNFIIRCSFIIFLPFKNFWWKSYLTEVLNFFSKTYLKGSYKKNECSFFPVESGIMWSVLTLAITCSFVFFIFSSSFVRPMNELNVWTNERTKRTNELNVWTNKRTKRLDGGEETKQSIATLWFKCDCTNAKTPVKGPSINYIIIQK